MWFGELKAFSTIVEGDMDRNLEILKIKFGIFFVWILLKLVVIQNCSVKDKTRIVNESLVFLQTKHMLLTDHGAHLFAKAMGIPEIPGEKLITERSRERWKKNLEPDSNPEEFQK